MNPSEVGEQGSQSGQALLELESRHYAEIMSGLYGERLLQVGLWADQHEPACPNHLPYRVKVGLDGAAGDMQGASTALPVLSRSIQVVSLPHTLEFVLNADALIAEVYRVLSNDGRVIVLAYNPLSARGLARLTKRRRDGRWRGLTWTRARLRASGFSVAETRRYGLGWPALDGDPALDRRRACAYAMRAFSDGYLLLARKQVVPLTPTRQRQAARAMETGQLAREAVARHQCAPDETGNKHGQRVA